jgi:hypothetical protein
MFESVAEAAPVAVTTAARAREASPITFNVHLMKVDF